MRAVQELYNACVGIFRQSVDPVWVRGQLEGGGVAYELCAETPSSGVTTLIYSPFKQCQQFTVFLPGAEFGVRVAPHTNAKDLTNSEAEFENCLHIIKGSIPYPSLGLSHWYYQGGRPVAILRYERLVSNSSLISPNVQVAEGVHVPPSLTSLTPVSFWELRQLNQLPPINTEFLVDFDSEERLGRCSVWCGDQHLPQVAFYTTIGMGFSDAEQANMIELAKKFLAENRYTPPQHGIPFA